MLGTPTREDIHAMNPNYTEFKFPHIKAHPWSKVFSKRLPADAVDLVGPQTPCPLAGLPKLLYTAALRHRKVLDALIPVNNPNLVLQWH